MVVLVLQQVERCSLACVGLCPVPGRFVQVVSAPACGVGILWGSPSPRMDLGRISVKRRSSVSLPAEVMQPWAGCAWQSSPVLGWPWSSCNGKGVFVAACPRALELIAGIDPIDRASGCDTARTARRVRLHLWAPAGHPCAGGMGCHGGVCTPPPPHPTTALPCAGLSASKGVSSAFHLENRS